jgi:hypothetical protein
MTQPSVNYFRPRRPGPEWHLENHLVANFSGALDEERDTWIGGSLPLGAGMPDYIFATYEPELHRVTAFNRTAIEILAYLRTVGKARFDTVAGRLNLSSAVTEEGVAYLVEAGAIDASRDLLELTDTWRTVLPEVLAIEVKVSDWKRALAQATRNLIFCHRSMIALPEPVAFRVRSRKEFSTLGVGILSIAESGEISIARRARRAQPKSWRYYYELAFRITSGGEGVAVSDSN